MRFNINGEILDGEAISLSYPNDLLDGIFVDFGEKCIVLSDHVEEHRMYQEQIEVVEHFELSDMEVDISEPPHTWVVEQVGRLVVRTAEDLLE